jgi:MYXO-CTERM domain-containing protein
LAQVVTRPPDVLMASAEKLPKTASPLPLIALLGLLGLGAAFSLRSITARLQ